MFYYRYVTTGNIQAAFTTPLPDEPSRDVVFWTQEKNSRNGGSLKGWTIIQWTWCGVPDRVFHLPSPDAGRSDTELIVGMDVYRKTPKPGGGKPSTRHVLTTRKFRKKSDTFVYGSDMALLSGNSKKYDWFFQRVRDRLFDSGEWFGCPPAFCLKTQMDAMLGMKTDQGSGKNYMFCTFTGHYFFYLYHDKPFDVRYPKPSDAHSWSSHIPERDRYLEDGNPVPDLVFTMPASGINQMVYVIKANRVYRFVWHNGDQWWKNYKGRSPIRSMFPDLYIPYGTPNLDAVWFNPTEVLLYVYIKSETFACRLQSSPSKPEEGTHVFRDCTSHGELKAPGWTVEVDSVLTYHQDAQAGHKSLVTKGILGWYVKHKDEEWKYDAHEARLLHDYTDNYYEPTPFFKDKDGVCDYQNKYGVSILVYKVYHLLI